MLLRSSFLLWATVQCGLLSKYTDWNQRQFSHLHYWMSWEQYQTGLKLPILVSVRCDNLTELSRSYYGTCWNRFSKTEPMWKTVARFTGQMMSFQATSSQNTEKKLPICVLMNAMLLSRTWLPFATAKAKTWCRGQGHGLQGQGHGLWVNNVYRPCQ